MGDRPELVVSNRKHFYRWDGQLYPSVTGILRALPKDALTNWAAAITAEKAVRDIAQIYSILRSAGDENPTTQLAAMEILKRARFESSDRGKSVGSQVHAAIEKGAKPVGDAVAYVQAFKDWVDGSGAHIVAHEVPVVSTKYGYGGTADLIVDVDDKRVLVDLKTDRTGPYPAWWLQATAYANADHGLPEGGVDMIGILHLQPTYEGGSDVFKYLEKGEVVGVDANWYAQWPEESDMVTFRALRNVADWLGLTAVPTPGPEEGF